MFKRINITLPDDVLARADDFSRVHRYTRSGLIAAALESFVSGDSAAEVAREAPVAYGAGSALAPAAPATLEEIAPLLRGFFSARDDVEAAWVFGSVARREAGPMSDVDVAVLARSSVLDNSDLQFDLMTRLAALLDRNEVDVVVVPDAGVQVTHRALAEGVRVYGDGNTRATEAEIRAATEYWDFETVRRMLDDRLTERLKPYGSHRP